MSDTSRFVGPVAVGAAVAAAYVAGKTLLERRRARQGDASTDAAGESADLGTELRGAAGDLAVTLLDRATERLERANA